MLSRSLRFAPRGVIMEVVLDNTDGVTMAKLARTAKFELTPVHRECTRIGYKEYMKHKWMQLLAELERYEHGDVPVEFRISSLQPYLYLWITRIGSMGRAL